MFLLKECLIFFFSAYSKTHFLIPSREIPLNNLDNFKRFAVTSFSSCLIKAGVRPNEGLEFVCFLILAGHMVLSISL
jgi:hypothetical protein